MKGSVELKRERASKVDAQKLMVDAAKSEANRVFSDEEITRFDALQGEIDGLDAAILRAEKFEASQAKRSRAGKTVGDSAPNPAPKEKRSFSWVRAINAARSNKSQTGAEASALQEGLEEVASRGLNVPEGVSVAIPSSMLIEDQQRNISVSGDSGEKGGEFVETLTAVSMPLLLSLIHI